MANKKPIPLKDEKADPLEEIRVHVSSIESDLNTLKHNKSQAEMQPSELFKRTISNAVVNAVKEYLEKRDRQRKEEDARKAGDETMPDYATLLRMHEATVSKHNNLLDFVNRRWPEMANQCNNTVSSIESQNRQNSESLAKIAQFIDIKNEGQSGCVPPPFPKSMTEVRSFLKRYLLYLAKRLRLWERIRMVMDSFALTAWTLVFCFQCFVAYDNARLRTVEEKYILLRDFSRLDKATSERADFIEWLYSDEDEHRQKIDTLWQMRRERMEGKKRE